MVEELVPFSASIANCLISSAAKYRNCTALKLGDDKYSYHELFHMAKCFAQRLMKFPDRRVLIFLDKELGAYVSLLATLLAGKAYIFLNAKESPTQLARTARQCLTRLIIINRKYFELYKSYFKFYHVIFADDLVKDLSTMPSSYQSPGYVYQYAYIMFTSGTTSDPKGVPISHNNLIAFLTNVINRTQPEMTDMFSHINELTFDFSVYEIFSCWLSGACLCVFPDAPILNIPYYIKDNQITYWSSVPSIISLLHQYHYLSGDHFSSIIYSVFCGDILTIDNANFWGAAAFNSIIDNLYGPTEATVAICGYQWKLEHHDLSLPIGTPFANQAVYLLNAKNKPVEPGAIGQICLAGSQVADHYWEDGLTSQQCYLDFQGERLYQTGDLAIFNYQYGLIFRGRMDDQFKFNGYRIERNDIETRLKAILATELIAVVIDRDKRTKNVVGLRCYYSAVCISPSEANRMAKHYLPHYMCPTQFIHLRQFPFNINGKIDYALLSHSIVE